MVGCIIRQSGTKITEFRRLSMGRGGGRRGEEERRGFGSGQRVVMVGGRKGLGAFKEA